jgi:hypothetical protein
MKQNVTVIPQIRMFFKDEDRTNSFVMLRQKKHLRKQTYTRYRMGSVVMFNCAESPISTQRRFRISELTSNVPYAVRSTLRNDR